ncbi:NEDD8-conjugating protein ubc12 [Paraphaeosphaeria minitans]
MMKIWSMKKQQKDAEVAAAASGKKKFSAADLRVIKDLDSLSLSDTMKLKRDHMDNYKNFILAIDPDEGMYKGGHFEFSFEIKPTFPYDAPKVRCMQKIYHPNIDLEGNVCLNILREDWKPVLNLNAIFVGVQYLFLEPNASDPLNKEAAEDLKHNREGFKRNVRAAMGGGTVKGESFDRVLK